MSLVKVAKTERNKFLSKVLRAPARSGYVFGQRVPTKNDIRREYIANMKIIAEVAAQEGDQEALDYCKGAVSEPSCQDDINAINALKVQGD